VEAIHLPAFSPPMVPFGASARAFKVVPLNAATAKPVAALILRKSLLLIFMRFSPLFA
jgi:hypothetical protein